MAGYSGTPLAQKLGLKAPLDVLLVGAPPDYASWLGDLPPGVSFVASTKPPVRAAHVFVSERAKLAPQLAKLRRQLEPSGFVWVSWPKKSAVAKRRQAVLPDGAKRRQAVLPDGAKRRRAVLPDKVATDITEDTIRALALPLGFVDIKVCAVSDVWSGLKLVIRKEER